MGRGRKRDEFYLKKYALAFYDRDDELLGVFDNKHELKEFLKNSKTKFNENHFESRFYKIMRNNGENHIFGRWSKIYLIDMENENEL